MPTTTSAVPPITIYSVAPRFGRAPTACLALAVPLLLAACGGGDGDPGTPPGNGFTVGGLVSGLADGRILVLQNNQGDDLALTANGRFLFGTALAGASAYAVRVQSQPAGQTCTVTNASGTVADAPVQSVQVACTATTWGLPEGDWAGEYCSPAFPNPGQLSHLRITRQSETSLTATHGDVAFTTADCSGRGAVYPESIQKDRIVFDRQESRGDLTAFWGNQLVDGAPSLRVVWARKGAYLCRLYQDFRTTPPTDYLTLDSVVQGTDKAIALKQCHQPSTY